MEYVRVGKSGLKVSRLCLGCLTYGKPTSSHPWALDEEASRPLLKQALESGINFFDTANVYSDGASEEILGRAIRDFTRREEVVLATKLHGRTRPGPNGSGLSRKALMTEVDASLKRLGTDYIDLYQIHRWDYDTPIDETLEGLHDLVRSGKVLYVGASSMYAWQFCQSLYRADLHGWTRFISMQNHYNLLYREEEREMLPLCQAEGIGVLPWSPLARGRLTRGVEAPPTVRAETDGIGKSLYSATEEADRRTIERVSAVAAARGLPQAQIALAWLLHKPAVTSPIIGANKPKHLEDALAALSVRLDESELRSLEKDYVAHPIVAFS